MTSIPTDTVPLSEMWELADGARVAAEIERRHAAGLLAIYGTRPGKRDPDQVRSFYKLNWIGPPGTRKPAPSAEREFSLDDHPAVIRLAQRDRFENLFVAREDWGRICGTPAKSAARHALKSETEAAAQAELAAYLAAEDHPNMDDAVARMRPASGISRNRARDIYRSQTGSRGRGRPPKLGR